MLKNIATVVSDPAILRQYLPWVASRFMGRQPQLVVQDVNLRGFPNFSSLLGAARYQPEASEISTLLPYVERADVVFDVGANFGVFSVLFARWAPGARIFSFEPNPSTSDALQQNLRFNNADHVKVIQKAVGDQDGTVMFSSTADPATNKILGDGKTGIAVPLTTIQSICEEHIVERIDFIKIDVEGAELGVLEGARDLFAQRRISAGMIELCPDNLRAFGKSLDDLVSFFDEHDYELKVIGKNNHELDPRSEKIGFENALFKQRDREA